MTRTEYIQHLRDAEAMHQIGGLWHVRHRNAFGSPQPPHEKRYIRRTIRQRIAVIRALRLVIDLETLEEVW